MANKRKPTSTKKPPSVVAPVGLIPPAALDHHEQAVWDELVRDTPWLTKFDRFNLQMFACALAKYRENPKAASNALHSRLKSLGSKLRFDDPPASLKLTPEPTKNSRYFDGGPESAEETRARRSREIGRKYFGEDDPEDEQ